MSCELRRYGGKDGTGYGAWTLCANLLSEASTVFSVGIGGDISFDKAVVSQHNARVFAFDPTISGDSFERLAGSVPKAQRSRISFYPFGLGATDTVIPFFRSTNSKIGSLSSSGEHMRNYQLSSIRHMPVLRIQTLLAMSNTQQIDVLKVDIEGAEWSVFNRSNTAMCSWLSMSRQSTQIALEFHERLFKAQPSRRSINNLLKKCGYQRQHQSASKEEVLYLKTTPTSHLDCCRNPSWIQE